MSQETLPAGVATGRSLLLIRSGNLLYVSPDGRAPCPPDVVALLHPHLTYDQREFLYGFRARDPATGQKKRIEITEKRLFSFDNAKRLYTNFGFLERVTATLKAAGFNLAYLDLNARNEEKKPHKRPERYFRDPGNVTHHFQFRARQDECLASVANNQHGLVHAVTGFGKMAMGVMICLLYPKAKIHIVTKRVPLVLKWTEYLSRYMPNIGQFGAGSKYFGDRITVFTTKSLKHTDFDADILLGDEIHEVVNDEAVPILSRYQNTRNFGLTATPVGRGDGSDPRLEAIFGPRIFYMPYWEAVDLGLVVPMQVRWHDVILDGNPAAGLEDVERRRQGIWLNEGRNNIIAKAFLDVPADEQKMVLTETIYQAVELYQRLKHTGVSLVYDNLDGQRFEGYKISGALPKDLPKMTPSIKEQHRKRFESGEGSYIATPTWAVGIDPIYLQHMFMAAAWQNEILCTQGPGRASRINGAGKAMGILHDFRDQFDNSTRGWSRSRFKVYKSLRWEQTLVTPTGIVPTAS